MPGSGPSGVSCSSRRGDADVEDGVVAQRFRCGCEVVMVEAVAEVLFCPTREKVNCVGIARRCASLGCDKDGNLRAPISLEKGLQWLWMGLDRIAERGDGETSVG